MLKRPGAIVALAMVCCLGCALPVQAKMIQVKPNAFTHNSSTEQSLRVFIETASDSSNHPPSYVTGIVVVDPNGKSFAFNEPFKLWDPQSKGFTVKLPISTWGTAIPSGTYKVTVSDAAGVSITLTDAVDGATLLPRPTINPLGAVTSTPNVSWSKVTGAKYYRLLLTDDTNDVQIYHFGEGYRFDTNMNNATIPKGVLQPNRTYQLAIEARSDTFDYDKRSRTDWISFTTGAW